MKKTIELGKTYFNLNDGTYIIPKQANFDYYYYYCDVFETDDDGNEINRREEKLTANDILKYAE